MTIDWWTLALQTVNVLILAWLLGRFLFRPVAEIIDKRQSAAQSLIDDAEAQREKARAELAEIASIRQGFSEEREKIVLDARKAAETEKAKLLDAARKDVEKAMAANKAALEHDRAEAERRMTGQASELAVVIARRLVSTIPAQSATAALIASLPDAIAALPDDRRDLLATAAGRDKGLTFAAAAALSEDEQSNVREVLGKALGEVKAVEFTADADLIAGFELRGGDVVLRRSWQDDLTHILNELRGKDGRTPTT